MSQGSHGHRGKALRMWHHMRGSQGWGISHSWGSRMGCQSCAGILDGVSVTVGSLRDGVSVMCRGLRDGVSVTVGGLRDGVLLTGRVSGMGQYRGKRLRWGGMGTGILAEAVAHRVGVCPCPSCPASGQGVEHPQRLLLRHFYGALQRGDWCDLYCHRLCCGDLIHGRDRASL